jgi:signal peptide peptidase SppA
MSVIDTVKTQVEAGMAFARKVLGAEVPVVPLVRMEGMIASGGRQGVLNLTRLERLLDRAFANTRAPAIAIAVNSPGGSPVQSRLIHDRIRRLAAEKDKPVLVFCEDLAASGGYMIACAGDEVFADPASIVGSIGVISAGFGFTDAMEKLGVERRVKTAGKSKVLADPFAAETDEQKARMNKLLESIHAQFIALVKERRGDKLDTGQELFDGSIFTGEEALKAGLVDGLAEARSELRRRFGETTKVRVLTPTRSGLLSLFAGAVVDVMETRFAWARFGL